MKNAFRKMTMVICTAALLAGLLAGCGRGAFADGAAETAGQTTQEVQSAETAGADERETAAESETPETTVSTEAAETTQAVETLPAAETPDTASEEGDIFSGGYYDTNSGRAQMLITPNDDGTYLVEITWSGSYNSAYVWGFITERDGTVLTYTRGAKSLVIYDENGDYAADENGIMTPLIERDDLQGSFTLEDGVITWDDQTEHAGDDCSFVRDYNYSHIEITR